MRVDIAVAGDQRLGGLLDGALQRNVESLLSIRRDRKKDLSVARLRQLHGKAEKEISEALEPFGYYRPTVQGELTRDGETWTAGYDIEPGPQIELDSVIIEITGPGADEDGFQQAVSAFPLAEGNGLDHSAYESGKTDFISYAVNHGYLDGAFETSQIRIDLDRYTSQIQLRFDTGPRYLFGDVTFHQDILDADVLKGYIQLERGEPIDLSEILELQDDLSNSPYFQRVEVIAREDEADGLIVPVDVETVPAARQKWDFGLGYGTDTGPRGVAAFEFRRINRQGHRGTSEFTLSDIEQSFSARYLIPGYYPRTDVLTFSVGYEEVTTDTSSSETAIVGVGRTQSRGRWREAIALTYERTDFEVGLDQGISELIIPQATWSRVKTEDRIYPLSGWKVDFSLRGADESLGSDSSFAQTTIEAKLIESLSAGTRGLRIHGRVGLGYTWTDDFRQLPGPIRFFAGGDRSVRGYGYQDLGRLDEAGNVIGGETLATASVELDYLFANLGKLGRWGAAAFYDVGNASAKLAEDLERGTGIGIRWLSPIGLVRADVAWAVSQPDTPVRFHLMIGPDL